MKNWHCIFFASMIALTATSCCGPKPQAKSDKSSLTLNFADDPASLDPRQVRLMRDFTLVRHLYEGLTRIDANGKPVPAIAEAIDISDDKLTYVFHLRPSQWSDGTPLTADDFATSWKEALSPSFVSDYFHMLYPVKNAKQVHKGKSAVEELGVTVIDSQTLKVELESPLPYFLELTAFPTYFPVRRSSPNADAVFAFNGPFYLAKWEPKVALYLEKNASYWAADKVKLEEIAFHITPDSLTEVGLYEKGELDWLGQPLSHSIVPEFLQQKKKEGKVASYPVAGTSWLTFNTQKAPFNRAKMRRAFSQVINRQAIITHLLQGGQSVATGPVPLSIGLQTTPYFQDGNVAYAQQLFKEAMEEAGWNAENLPAITLYYYPSERMSKVVQFVQQEWQQAFGIPVALESVEYHVYRQKIKLGDFQIGPGEWIADFLDPITFLELFKDLKDAEGNGLNDTGWHNDEYSTLIELAMKESNWDKRREYLHNAESIIVEESPIIPLYHYSFDYVKSDDINGVIFSPLGLVDFREASR